MKKTFATTLACATLLCVTLTAQGQTKQADRFALEVSPPVKYIQIKPGSKLSHTITLKNVGAFGLEVYPQVVDFRPDGETNRPILEKTTSFQYIEIPKGGWPTVSLKPNQTAQLTLNFSVPADAPEKEYPLSVLFSQSREDGTTDSTRISGAVGSNLIVLISDKNKPAADLQITSAGIFPLLDSFGTLSVEPLITNNGFSAQPINGTVTIRDWRGNPLAEFALFPDVILGSSSRRARGLSSEKNPQAIEYAPNWLLGLYQVDIQITAIEPGTEGSPQYIPITSQRQTVFALPYVVVIVLIFSSILAITYSVFSSRRIRL